MKENNNIEILDLESIMVKVMNQNEGLGWSLEYTTKIAIEYKKYLTTCLDNKDLPIVPSKPIDEFWHFHILDTMKYQEDCQNIFGYFLHHFPYFGMRDKEDEENLNEAWESTLLLYERTFNEKVDENIWLGSARCPNCGRRVVDSKFYMEQRPRLKDVA